MRTALRYLTLQERLYNDTPLHDCACAVKRIRILCTSKLKGEVGMVVPKSTQTRVVGIIIYMHGTSLYACSFVLYASLVTSLSKNKHLIVSQRNLTIIVSVGMSLSFAILVDI